MLVGSIFNIKTLLKSKLVHFMEFKNIQLKSKSILMIVEIKRYLTYVLR